MVLIPSGCVIMAAAAAWAERIFRAITQELENSNIRLAVAVTSLFASSLSKATLRHGCVVENARVPVKRRAAEAVVTRRYVLR
jgi:hypothetical protein